MRYLLDTDICIYLIKRRPPKVIDKLLHLSNSDIALSTVTVFELQYGVECSRQAAQSQAALDQFLEAFPTILEVDLHVAHHGARTRAELRAAGTPIGPYDVLIAATAIAHDLTLVSNNAREFKRVKNLRFENWCA